MKTGILHLNLKLDKVSDFKRVWDQFVSELHREKSDFRSAFLFINPENGKCTSIGFYDSQESAKALMSTAAYKKFVSDIRDFTTGEPTREVCDVSGDVNLITAAKKAA